MKNFPGKIKKNLRRNGVKYIVVVTVTGAVVVMYGALLTITDMESFLKDKGLFEEWQNQTV